MNINELTIGQAKDLASLFNNNIESIKAIPFKVGNTYLIRTVTMAWHGTVKEIIGDFLILEDSAWIADTGRYSNSLKDPNNYNEVEPSPVDTILNITSVVDAQETKKIKLEQK